MFVVARRFFATGAVTEAEKASAEVAAKLQKEFSDQCFNVMKVRGHHKLELGTVKSKNGKSMTFDFSYGWPTRYYCKCNTSAKTITKEEMAQFEKDCEAVGVTPNHAVYFSKGAFEGNPEKIRPLFIGPKALETMMKDKNARHVRSNKVIFFCLLAMSYLAWTFFSEKNPQRRRLIERYHRYIAKDEVKKPDPWAEAEAAEAAAAAEAALREEEEKKEEKPVEPVVEASVEAPVEAPVETPAETPAATPATPVETVVEAPAKEEKTEEPAAESQGVLGYISSTFWWLLGYK